MTDKAKRGSEELKPDPKSDTKPDTKPDHEGVLFKKGQVRWNARYFVLRGKTLMYWESEHMAKVGNFRNDPRGQVSITCVECLGRVENHYFFDVHGSPKTLSLYAETEDDRDIWTGKINSRLIVEAEMEGLAANRITETTSHQTLRVVELSSIELCLVLNMELVVLEASGEAFEKGVRVGDRIVSINKTVCTGKARDEVTEILLRAPRPYTVTFHSEWVRKSEALSVAMVQAFTEEEKSSKLAHELKAMQQKLEDDRKAMHTDIDNRKAALRRDRDKLTADMLQFEREKKMMMESSKDDDLLNLNIGGERKITVSRSTLCLYPHSRLSWQYNGRHNDKLTVDSSGNIFIDLPPDLFVALVDQLRLQRLVGVGVGLPAPLIAPERRAAWLAMLKTFELADKVAGSDEVGMDSPPQELVLSLSCMQERWEDVTTAMYGFMFDVCAMTDVELVGLRVCGCMDSDAVVYVCEGSHTVNHNEPSKWQHIGGGRVHGKQSSTLTFSMPLRMAPSSVAALYIATNHIRGIAFVSPSPTSPADTANKHISVSRGHFLSSQNVFDYYTSSDSGYLFQGVIDYIVQS
eukprot:c4704_g1_i1.p1 GENE.c4704_g1_i1~~c4704_g1_i1.p1  ORF type:complete len:577 (+),score=137.34 c4704_g1_i1:36-1766(+)